MKRILSIFTFVSLAVLSFAQAPNKMTYQSVVRDGADALVINSTIGLQISFYKDSITSTPVYVETFTPTTNTNGLVSVQIGTGIIVSGSLATIDWGAGSYYIKTEVDIDGGTNYNVSGTSEFVSVPYAFMSQRAALADSLIGGTTESDPVYGASVASAITAADTTNWNMDNSTTNELQTISISNDTIMLSEGGMIVLPAQPVNNDNDSTNEIQSLSISNDTINLTDGGFVVLPVTENNDNDSTNEIQQLLKSNDTLYLNNGGGFVTFTELVTWMKNSGNLYFETGDVAIGHDSPDQPLHVYDSISHGSTDTESAVYVETKVSNSTANSHYAGILSDVEGTDAENTGVAGTSSGTSTGSNYGLWGRASGGATNYGVFGTGSGSAFNTYGVYGSANSTNSSANSTNRGVRGDANSTTATFNQGILGFAGSTRTSTTGYNAGVLGEATGHSETNYGMLTLSYGTGNNNYGGADFVYGNVSGSKKNIASYGYAWGADTNMAFRAYAKDDPSAVNYGIYSEVAGANSLAGRFIGNTRVEGNLVVTGSISKGSGTFKIDHPQDPENKFLIHSFVESPDMMNVYNGNAVTDASGIAIVELPDYVESANKDFRYQLTPIGQFAQCIIKEKVNGNKFVIQTDKPNVEVSWMITGIRNDPYSNLHRIEPVVNKEGQEVGKYLHPEAYGKDKSLDMYPPVNFGDTKKELEMIKKSSQENKAEETISEGGQ